MKAKLAYASLVAALAVAGCASDSDDSRYSSKTPLDLIEDPTTPYANMAVTEEMPTGSASYSGSARMAYTDMDDEFMAMGATLALEADFASSALSGSLSEIYYTGEEDGQIAGEVPLVGTITGSDLSATGQQKLELGADHGFVDFDITLDGDFRGDNAEAVTGTIGGEIRGDGNGPFGVTGDFAAEKK